MKVSDNKCHGNPSTGGRAHTCGQTNGRADMTKLIGALREYAKSSKSLSRCSEIVECSPTSRFRNILVWHLNCVCFPFTARCVLCVNTLKRNIERRGVPTEAFMFILRLFKHRSG
jgi:hypothetical protein